MNERKTLRCAVYTRKSSEHGLEQDFNSLDARREAAEAYIKSQAHEGWRLVKTLNVLLSFAQLSASLRASVSATTTVGASQPARWCATPSSA
jgi:hypothetical protein